jgi:geranylgeranyl diphosphate synthase, type II
MTNNFLDKVTSLQLLINNSLEVLISKPHKTNIYDAMGYSLLAGGKRLRPLILLSFCEDSSLPISDCLPFACAVEMIHTYSLIHDDLPAMDNDDFRRGKPTNHKVYGEAMAILAGDGLLNLAFETMIDASIDNSNKLKAMKEIAFASGINGMIGGQVMDILSEDKIIDHDTLIYIHKNKTGAILKSCFVSGAILSNESKERIKLYELAGSFLGLAFQIKDDLLEATSTPELLGKSTYSDINNKKSTYVSLFGLKKANDDYINYSNKAINLLEELNVPFLKYIALSLIDRKS